MGRLISSNTTGWPESNQKACILISTFSYFSHFHILERATRYPSELNQFLKAAICPQKSYILYWQTSCKLILHGTGKENKTNSAGGRR